MKIILITAFIFLIFLSGIKAQSDRDLKVFSGFNSIAVGVAEVNDDIKSLGLDTSQVKLHICLGTVQ